MFLIHFGSKEENRRRVRRVVFCIRITGDPAGLNKLRKTEVHAPRGSQGAKATLHTLPNPQFSKAPVFPQELATTGMLCQ